MRKYSKKDRLVNNIILAAVSIAAVLLLIYIKQFIGFAVSIAAEAGYITEIDIQHREQTYNWQGLYGLLLMQAGYFDEQTHTGDPGEIAPNVHLVFNCLQPNIDHEVYASLVDPDTLDWSTAQPARSRWIDEFFGTVGSASGANNTFLKNGSIQLGATTISNIPWTYTRTANSTNQSTYFGLGILNVSGQPVFVTTEENLVKSYNNATTNYQMMLPTVDDNTKYYFTVDPYDSCPAGLGTGLFGDGIIQGFVRDIVSNNTIINATINIGPDTNYSDSSGWYNISTKQGTQYIIATFPGYYTYTALVNITLGLTTTHDIYLTPMEATAEEGIIAGTVRDDVTGQLLPNVTVYAGDAAMKTNGNGYFVGQTYSGTFLMVGVKPDYEFYMQNVTIGVSNTTIYNFSMIPRYGIVQGYVIENGTDELMDNVTVSITDRTNVTNSTGFYSIRVPTGEHVIVATKSDYDPYVNTTIISPGLNTTLNITLFSTGIDITGWVQILNGSIQGYVTDATTSLPIPNASVSLAGQVYNTDSEGFYNISAFKGTHIIVSLKSGYDNFIGNVTIIANYTIIYNISMQPTEENAEQNGSITGLVKNEVGTLQENVTISVAGVQAQSNSTGGYWLDAVAGTHNLVAIKSGLDPYFAEIDLYPGNITYHNITMNTTQVIAPSAGGAGGAGGGSAGGGASAVRVIERLSNEEKKEEYPFFRVSIAKIVKKLRKGTFANVPITISNYKQQPINLQFEITGDAAALIDLDRTSAAIGAANDMELTLTILGKAEVGLYEGELLIKGDIESSIPIVVWIYEKDKLPIEGLLVKLDVMETTVTTGDLLRYRVDLQNLLREESYNVRMDYFLYSNRTGEKYLIAGDDVEVKTFYSLLKNFYVPDDIPLGEYTLTVDAKYLDYISRNTEVINVVQPAYRYSVLGFMELWKLLLILLGIALLIYLIKYYKKKQKEKQRYKSSVKTNDLPQAGPRSAFVGTIAETSTKTYFDLDKFQIHTLLAGASGSGKSVAAQVLAEEALDKGVSVVVFDPNANWTGFLRKQTNKELLRLYTKFDIKKNASKSYPGNVYQIENGRQLIEFGKFFKSGEISVIVTNKLEVRDRELLFANTIKELFRSSLPEESQLKYLLIYDGIHTLLPKYGGSGRVFIQIERAAREFRKWGIGLILISQVLTDFPKEVLANINTEIQLRTKAEGDLNRIKDEYGDDMLKSLVKAAIGTGMIEMAAYNKGKPYFVSFRPVLHSLDRLSEEDLANYKKYNAIMDDLDYQLEQLKELGVDIFDLRLELKLAKDKMKSGGFNMVDIYLDGLTPRIEKQWEKLGKKPKKVEIKLGDAELDALKEKQNIDDSELKTEEGAPGMETKSEEDVKKDSIDSSGIEEEKKQQDKKKSGPDKDTGVQEDKKGPPAQESEEKEAAPEPEPKPASTDDNFKGLLNKAKQLIESGKKEEAKGLYTKIMDKYKSLPAQDKKGCLKDCLELRKSLS